MSNVDRAKQFLPFDALKGLREELEAREEKMSRVPKHSHSEEQMEEIKNAGYFIDNYGFINALTLPFGDYNEDTLDILKKLDIDFLIGVSYTNNDKCLVRVDCSTLA